MAHFPHRPWLIGAAALGAALLAVIGINLFDQELTPEARALFRPAPREFARDSAWALMIGFNAPAGEDPRAFSERLWRARKSEGKAPPRPHGLLEVRGAAEMLCQPEVADCVNRFRQRPEAAADLVGDHAALLGRYDELLRSTDLADATGTFDYFSGMAPLSAISSTQRIRLSQAAAAAAAGRADEAIAWIEADASFYRRWLEEAGSIVTKMIAVRGLARDLLLAGQITRFSQSLTTQQRDSLERIAAPLTGRQRAFAHAASAEAVYFAEIVDQWVAAPRATGESVGATPLMADFLGRALKPNATLNFAYPLYATWFELDAVESSALVPAIEAAMARVERHAAPDWTWLFNFAGKSTIADVPTYLVVYLHRLRDLDALAAVMRCAVALRRAGATPDGAGAIATSSPACVNPLTAKPFDWNGREISFQARSEGAGKRFGGAGNRVAFAVYP